MLNKVYDTKQLFYNKFLYCLKIPNKLSPIFRDKNLITARKILDILHRAQNNKNLCNFSSYDKAKLPLWITENLEKNIITYDDLLDATIICQTLTDSYTEFKTRVCWTHSMLSQYQYREGPNLRIYTNDKIKLLQLSNKTNVQNDFYCPNNDTLDVLKNNPNAILCNNDNYKFKLVFNHKKINNSFAKWYDANKNKIKISSKCLHHLKKYGILENRYILVRDKHTLTILNLLLQPNIRKIYDLVCDTNLDK